MSRPTILPSSKHLLTSILASLQDITPTNPAGSTSTTTITNEPHTSLLAHLPEPSYTQAKNVLLTLHFLFPHELLPALDLIDRRLITHLYTSTPTTSEPRLEIYYVQSASSVEATNASARRGRFRNALSRSGLSYEVRVDSWNCSCPAFAYGGLKLMMRDAGLGGATARHEVGDAAERVGLEWAVGGIATKDGAVIPVCKHILAVALAKAAPGLFGNGVAEREVSREEIAGWAAGWGEH